MKLPFATALMMTAMLGPAAAQTPLKRSDITPKPIATVPIRPDGSVATTADAAAKAKEQGERLAIQSDLAWINLYNGVINGEASERLGAAIKTFQKNHKTTATGSLTPQERSALNAEAKKLRDNVGWTVMTDPLTGSRVGLPKKLLTQVVSDVNGTKWSSATGAIQVELARRKEAAATTATVADKEKKVAGRKVTYSVVKPDFFVLAGTQGLKKFYIRGQTKSDEVRILTVLYDQATDGTMAPVIVAMSSAFNPFPTLVAQPGPPPRKKIEYSTGIVVSSDGAILVDRQATEACDTIVVPAYGNAARIAQDKDSELALIHIYGVSDLKPLGMASSGATKPHVSVFGIADPQNQAGRSAVTNHTAVVTPVGTNITLSPEPGLGFSGAAAVDSDGSFAGIARLKPAVVAGPSGGPVPAQALLVSADTVRRFLKSNDVTAPSSQPDAKASLLRVICIRK
ncbi:peptidoglycan-binding protein [Bradyrhizobium sp. SYSU BS000235]|uniref:peptidoglycan-binding protein n=1 Tax=Bradyrhizobium sp. SYSU BS000235 TaxID=3411332 RepID=UPI003C783887